MIIRCARCSWKMVRRTLRWDADICYCGCSRVFLQWSTILNSCRPSRLSKYQVPA